jgi:P-type E1-E2 ATPase
MFNGVIIVLLVGYSYSLKLPLGEIIPLVLTAVLASIPVALPATFTLAAALGARALAHLGVLPTRLSAVDEAASIEVLCVDKTGTLMRNEQLIVWSLLMGLIWHICSSARLVPNLLLSLFGGKFRDHKKRRLPVLSVTPG